MREDILSNSRTVTCCSCRVIWLPRQHKTILCVSRCSLQPSPGSWRWWMTPVWLRELEWRLCTPYLVSLLPTHTAIDLVLYIRKPRHSCVGLGYVQFSKVSWVEIYTKLGLVIVSWLVSPSFSVSIKRAVTWYLDPWNICSPRTNISKFYMKLIIPLEMVHIFQPSSEIDVPGGPNIWTHGRATISEWSIYINLPVKYKDRGEPFLGGPNFFMTAGAHHYHI